MRGFFGRGSAPNPRGCCAGTPKAPRRAREARMCAPWPSATAPNKYNIRVSGCITA